MKLHHYEFKREEPATPPRHLKRWFVEFDPDGQVLTLILLVLAGLAYMQINALADGIVVAVLRHFWTLWVLTILVSYLLALDLTAVIYERTTGSAYRTRERELLNLAANAEARALSAAQEAVRERTLELDEQEAALADMQRRVRRESDAVHEQRLVLATRLGELKSRDQASCSGNKRRPQKKRRSPASFQDLGIP